MAFDRPGAQLLALDTQPFTIELTADKFTDYLHDEGLEHVIALREATGQRAIPGRERYRRHVKTLLNVSGKSDASFGVRTGQTLELVPLANPHLLSLGARELPRAAFLARWGGLVAALMRVSSSPVSCGRPVSRPCSPSATS